MAGHVFITRTDLRRLACDAWLKPTSIKARPNPKVWLLPDQPEPCWPKPTADWKTGKLRILKVVDWPSDMPQTWMVNVGGTDTTPISWFAEGVQQFLDTACAEIRCQCTRIARRKLLVALPIIGIGKGGAADKAGEVVQALLPRLHDAAERYDVDLALVAYDGPALAAAQAARWQLHHPRTWPELSTELRHEADRLADLASRGELALFLGAGVSVSAGLPLWGHLLDQLAERAGMSAEERQGLGQLDALDQASIIQGRLGSTEKLQQEIRNLCHRTHHSLAHSLLAALPVREVVTTNYDQLFEQAWRDCGRTPSLLPHALEPKADCWLLKMHGCVSCPDSIVLRREDYLGYAERRGALAGIVQAMLITRHMLFAGFSFKDDNFHRIADAVRRAIRGSSTCGAPHPFGTTLTLLTQPLMQELWKQDLRWVEMLPPEEQVGAEVVPEAARRLEIFLDYLLARTRDSAHLLNEPYTAVLTPEERQLRQAVLEFENQVPPAVRLIPAWSHFQKLFGQLGREAGN